MDAIRKRCGEYLALAWDSIDLIWENTPDGCGLQRFILDFITRMDPLNKYWTHDKIAEQIRNCHNSAFLSEVVIQLFKIRANQVPAISDREWFTAQSCNYHDHEGDDEQADKATADEIAGNPDE